VFGRERDPFGQGHARRAVLRHGRNNRSGLMRGAVGDCCFRGQGGPRSLTRPRGRSGRPCSWSSRS
jgi:hypothetical protein